MHIQGVVVVLANVSNYVRLALSNENVWIRPSQSDQMKQQREYEDIVNAVEKLRQTIQNNTFLFKKFGNNRLSITDFDQDLFWECVPLVLRNFVGLLTAAEDKFQKIKNEFKFYDLLEKDLFFSSSKRLKIASIAYDLINARDEKAITPKHLLLGNELYHHTRSTNILKVTNRLGHSCSYDTIRRLHEKAADHARQSSNQFHFIQEKKSSHQHNFIFKVADNFDLNPDGLFGNMKNIHILNRILVTTQENDEIPIVVTQLLDDLINDVIKSLEEPSVRNNFGNNRQIEETKMSVCVLLFRILSIPKQILILKHFRQQ